MSLQPDEEHFRKLEAMYGTSRINRFFLPELSVGEGRAEVVLPVREALFHAAGAVHGAAYFKALDDATFFAANSLVTDVFVLTVDLHINLVRVVTEGHIRAVGEVVSRSRRLLVAEGKAWDAEGRLVARASGTFMPGRTPLGPDIGYR